MVSRDRLISFFADAGEERREIAIDTIDEYIFFREKIEELKKLPLIQISKRNPEMQRPTTAGKMIKEYSQVVDAKRATLIRILNGVESTAGDELLKALKNFE